MASKSAGLVIERMETYLGRPLNSAEILKCEELVINFYTQPVLRYIDGLTKRAVPRDFNLVYHPIMNGVMRGAYRRNDVIRMVGRFKAIYDIISAFIGDGMSDSELGALIFLAENCSEQEVNAAISIARYHGAHNANYIKAVILGNRKHEVHRLARTNKKTKKFMPDEMEFKMKGKMPRVNVIRKLWRDRIKQATMRAELNLLELNNQKRVLETDQFDSIDFHGKTKRPDNRD